MLDETETTTAAVKIGARNAAADKARIQTIRDHAAAIDATCAELDGPVAPPDAAPAPTGSAPAAGTPAPAPTKGDGPLVCFGAAVKALGNGRVGGYLVKFTNAMTPDLAGDFFDAQTNYDLDPGATASVYYNHGFDPVLKNRKIGAGKLTVDDAGVWIEAQLSMRDRYEQAIYSMAEAGKLGWSSGSLPNLVEFEAVGKAHHVKYWPLGKDASLTPTPAAGLIATAVQPLKTWAEATAGLHLEPAVKAIDLQQRIDLIRAAVDDKFSTPLGGQVPGGPVEYPWCEYIYDNYIIVCGGTKRWRIDYTFDLTAGTVALADATPVEMAWVPTKGMLAMFPGQPVTIPASSTEVPAPEAGRSPAANSTDAAAKLKLEITLMEVELL